MNFYFYLFILIILNNFHYGFILSTNYLNEIKQSKFYENSEIENLSAPKIIIDNPLIIKFRDDSYRLKCEAIGNPQPIVNWFNNSNTNNRYDGFSLLKETNRYIINNNGNLEISNDSPKLLESYFCSATNVFGMVYSRKVEVEKIFLPTKTSISYETADIKSNQKAVFECIIKPEILNDDFIVKHWEIKINDDPIQLVTMTEGRYSMINVTKVPQLHIRNITKEDFRNMQVKCVLENKYSSYIIIDKEQWARPKEFQYTYYSHNIYYDMCKGSEISVRQGKTIELPWCSNPSTATVVWFKSDSSPIVTDEKIVINNSKFSLISETCGNLLIKNVDLSDEGYYFVKKDNKVLQDYTPFHLRVTVKIGLTISPSQLAVAFGKSVTFTCLVTGYPVTDIFWLHNGAYKKAFSQFRKDTKNTVTTLVIKEVTPDTAGVYQCVAESRNSINNKIIDGSQESTSVIINEMPPRLTSQIPIVPPKKLYATIKLDSASSVARIQCSFNATPKVSIEWFLDDELVPIDEVIVVELSKLEPYTVVATLQINLGKLNSIGDKWKFGGLYVAKATNIFGTAQCKTLAFIEGVFFIRNRSKIIIKNGQQFSLKCYVISGAVPEITWSKIKDGKAVKFPETHLEVESGDGREILISNVEKAKHDGSYECTAILGSRKLSKVFNISVAMPPLGITPFPEEETLYVGNTIENNCQPLPNLDLPWYAWWEFLDSNSVDNKAAVIYPSGRGYPFIEEISSTWRSESDNKDNYGELPQGVPKFLVSYPNTLSKLKINFSKNIHIATFTCVVQNNVGVVRKSFRVTIAVIEFNVTPPSNVNVILGGTFRLDCSHKPNQLQISIIWSHNNNAIPLYDKNEPQRIYRFDNGTLVVSNISETDPSEFLCMIKSKSTQIPISKMVKVSLQVPARIISMPDNIDVVRKSNYNLVCRVYGDLDKLQIHWQRELSGSWNTLGNTFRKEGKGDKITELTLQFREAGEEDVGRYKCIARNSYSKDDVFKFVRIAVVAVPGPIKIQQESIKIESRMLSLDWFEPFENGNKPILDYLITWKSENESFERNVTKKHIEMDKLRPDNIYNVSIRARNGVGYGEEVFQIMKTIQAIPEGPVLELVAVANSSTMLILTWKPPNPLLQNGLITNYEVCHIRIATKNFSAVVLQNLPWSASYNKQTSGEESFNKNIDVNEKICEFVNNTEKVFIDLPKFTGYGFRIAPINKMGIGPFAYVKERTMEDFPEKAPIGVTCTCTATTVSLEWNPPPQDSINGVLQHYRVRFFRPDYYGVERDGQLDSVTKTKTTLSSLIPYSNYSVQVAVVNRKGAGPLSVPLICVTHQAPPSAPEVVKAFPVNDTCIMVSWSPPLAPNGPLVQYCINVNRNYKEICLPAVPKQVYYTKFVCELNDGNDYEFQITAQNGHKGVPGTSGRVVKEQGSDRIVSIPKHVVIPDRSTVVLDCETIYKHSTQKWFHYQDQSSKPLQIIYSDSNYNLETNGSLVIHKSSNVTNGTYECTLPNSSSIKYTVSVVTVANGTPYPTEIYYYTALIRSISISWRSAVSPRPDDPITSFRITVSNAQGELLRSHEISPSERTYNIDNLTCGTAYKLELYAVNRVGHSNPEILHVRTLGTKPQWANSTSLLASNYPKSLCFRLTAFLEGQGCPPHKFIVTLSPANEGSSDISKKPVHLNFDDNNLHAACNNVSGLHPNTAYYYKIEAFNNAGSTFNTGHAKTLAMQSVTPLVIKNHDDGILNFFYKYPFYITIAVAICLAVVFVGLVLYFWRCRYTDQMQPPQKLNNNLQTFNRTQPILIPTPSLSHRNRRLPAPPCNTYDSGMTTVPKVIEEEEDKINPYATYAPLHLPEALSPNTRSKQGKKSTHDSTTYIAGSQTHSYQYPDMVGTSQQQQPSSSMDIHQNTSHAIESYENSPKQPLLKPGGTVYSKGYSIGVEARCPLLPQRTSESICQEPYRPGGSTWSNTTGSSTKELTSVFQPNYSADLSLGLREQDEDNCSTIRAHNSHEAYFESGSSDDPGIQNFTQERCPGQQAIEPRFTQPFRRQSSVSGSSTYDSVDAPPPQRRNMNSIPFSDPSSRFVIRQDTLTEEDESNNYQNKFVIV